MPSKPKDLEKKILADGWVFKEQNGSHRHYVHPTKPGKVTIPFHKGKELNKIIELSILRQAGLKNKIFAFDNYNIDINFHNIICFYKEEC